MIRDDWKDQSLCREVDPDLFFPEKNHHEQARDAKSICLSCDVRPDCLKHALDTDEQWGIWGGTTERERVKIRRRQRKADAANQERVAS